MASRSFRCTKTPKENPMKSERYKGVSGESLSIPRHPIRRCTHECVQSHDILYTQSQDILYT